MKRRLLTLLASSFAAFAFAQQGPGLVISEILPNPAGTDSPFEFVEMVATGTINFAATPYTVVACNNGSANVNGWITGGALSYAFEITSGTVNQGDVVYVGGTSMAATGITLRSINTGTTNGDGFGTAASGGVFGNGGTNADGVAIFNQPVASLTSTTVPVDAIFYGSAIGSAFVSTTTGYQLPVNDAYAGGKLQTNSFLAPDAGSAQFLVATGTFNPTSGSFTTARSWAITSTFTNNATSVTLSTAASPATVAFASTNQTVNENAGTVSVTVNVTAPNNGQVVFSVAALPFSTATYTSDYTQSATQFVIAAGASGPQTISIPVVDDAAAEKDEYIVLAFTQLYNVTAAANAAHYLYIKDNDTPAPVANNQIFLDLLGSFSNGNAASNSAEIVAYDPDVQRLFIANSIGAKLDIVDFSNPSAPVLISSNSITTYGNINSVAAHDSMVALAIENGTNPQDSGKVVFVDYNGNFISQVKVGAMPDMITFNHAGTKVLTANEGEPNQAYTNDPDGSVTVVDISGGVANITQANVSFITFTAFNGQENALRAQGIRIYGPGATTSKDFEPEYITVSDDDMTAWVTLQENNAIAKLDLQTNSVTQLMPLGYKSYASGSPAMDVSDQTAGINLSQFPVYGMFQPDALGHFVIGNQTYLFTANEGDSRAYSGLNEESRISAANLDATAFPYAGYMKSNAFMGRLNITTKLGDTDNDGDLDQLYSYGGRSFAIWNSTTGALVYDSGDDMERITSTDPNFSPMFNASNSTSPAPKNRSDDKGPEPEGTATGSINGEQYAFIAIERIGGVMVYNVSNPATPSFTGYYNNRSFATNGPDRGAEGIIFIADSLSPNGHALVILANETSSTLTIYQVSTCAEKAGVTVTPSSPTTICSGNTVALSATTVANTTYQWMMNGSNISGATSNTYTTNVAGDYQLLITNSTYACSGKTEAVNVSIAPAPTVTATASNGTICDGTTTNLSASGAASYSWMPGNLSGSSVTVNPSASTTFTVVGTSVYGCTDTVMIPVNVNPLPAVTSSANSSICTGNTATITANGATTYSWMPGNFNGNSVTVNPTTTTTYVVTGTDANGCTNTATTTITVNALPNVLSSANSAICNGSNATLSANGATNYNWVPGNLNGNSVTVNPTMTTTYVVTGTDANGCTNTATTTITVNALPNVSSSANSAICNGSNATLTANGATNYNWMPGNLTGNSVTVNPTVTTTYVVTGTDANGCTNTATTTITVNALPNVSSSANSAICNGSNATLSANGATNYNWMPGNLSGSTVTVSPTSTTTYVVTGTDVNGCTNTATTTITVNTLPNVLFTALSPDTMCTSGQPVQLSASPAGGTFTGPGISGSTFDPAVSGVGVAQLIYNYTDANGCSSADTTVAYVDLCTGTEISSAENFQLNILPNPNNGSFVVQLENMTSEMQLTLISSTGEVVERFTVNATSKEVRIDQLAAGVYVVIAEDGNTRATKRIIVQ